MTHLECCVRCVCNCYTFTVRRKLILDSNTKSIASVYIIDMQISEQEILAWVHIFNHALQWWVMWRAVFSLYMPEVVCAECCSCRKGLREHLPLALSLCECDCIEPGGRRVLCVSLVKTSCSGLHQDITVSSPLVSCMQRWLLNICCYVWMKHFREALRLLVF